MSKHSLWTIGLLVAACGGSQDPLDLGSTKGEINPGANEGSDDRDGGASAPVLDRVPVLEAANAASKIPTECTNCRVFVTSGVYTGDLGGLEGADTLCTQTAHEAGLGGKWIAWLSDSTHLAITRIHGDGPWNLVDGKTLAFSNHAALAVQARVQINHDEADRPYVPAYIWTGPTLTYYPGTSCADWTSLSEKGTYEFAGTFYGNTTDDECTKLHSLVCFEQ